MIAKRSLVARCVVALTTLALVSSAAPKNDKKKGGDDKSGSSMEEGGKDPAQTETFEEGQFVPGKKTTKKPEPCAEGDEDCEAKAAEAESKENEKEKEKEPEPAKPMKVRKTVGLFAEAIIGFGKAPEPGPGSRTTSFGNDGIDHGSSTSFGFMVGGHVDVTNPLRLMLRVPLSTGTIKNFNGKDQNEVALGVPEIAGRLRLGDPGETEWAVKLGIGIPIAQGNPDVTNTADARGWEQARLQRNVNAANGWHDPELYAMKRMPVSLSLGVVHRETHLRLNGEAKAVFLPQIGGTVHQPDASVGGTYEYNGLGVWALLGGSASYEFVKHFYGALAAWVAYEIARDYEWNGGNPPTPIQFVMEPRILAQFGKVIPSVGFLIPIGGQLGGNMYGLRLHVDVVF
jgi:hypothetical protein